MNRILVIEDDPAIRRGLADNLQLESYDVLTAADGLEGFRLACETKFDLLILDLMLPGLDGYEVCRRLRSQGLETPVLMLTADDQESSRVRGFDAGTDDYVAKPFSIRELLGRVRAILRRTTRRPEAANQKELDDARTVQKGFMPEEIPRVSGLRIDAVWRPAQTVGGDYFDVVKLDDRTVAVCIADVCGKGLPAAMMMSNLQASVRSHISNPISPRELCRKVNRMMCANTPSNTFVSFFYGIVDTELKQLTYCNAGHNPPILFRRGGAIKRLDCGGGILGVFEDWCYEERAVRLETGDRVLMYTDGITESRNDKGEEFGERRLIDLLLGLNDNESMDLTAEVLGVLSRFNNGDFEDDLTVLGVTVE